jgi:CubicO group peptidase (beta-lactamase class C family)
MGIDLPRSTPAEQGVDSTGIDAFIAALAPLDDVELHSLMVLRHGHVVAEHWWPPYAPQTPQLLYSLSKSFTSTALGFAVAEGLVDLDATVLSYFPELDDQVTDERSRRIKVRHVAAMASGHADDTFDEAVATGNTLLGFLRIPPDEEPGTIFAYNQSCTYSVGRIIRQVTGSTLLEFLQPRLFEPLGISTYGWYRDRQGFEQGFSGLFMVTETIAKLGQLYLDQGRWQGAQLLPESWIAEATRSHVSCGTDGSDWAQGYGFQFWRSRHGYRGDGAYGQYMQILPEADAVVVITSQSPDMPAVLDAVWAHLLPALTTGTGPAGAWAPPSGGLALPVAVGKEGELSAATLRPAAGSDSLLRTVEVTGAEVTLRDHGDPVTVPIGRPGQWSTTGPVVSSSAWVDGTLELDLVFVETPHRLRVFLDPAAGTFEARWKSRPLGPMALSWLRMPH